MGLRTASLTHTTEVSRALDLITPLRPTQSGLQSVVARRPS